jgi:RNA polymerase sigma factor (sigma-70 family)
MTQSREHDERDALAAYLDSVSAVDPLTREQEVELFQVLAETERELRTTVLEGPHGMELVLHLGRELRRGTLRVADVVAHTSAGDFDERAERDRLLTGIAELERLGAPAGYMTPSGDAPPTATERVRSLGLGRRAVMRLAQEFLHADLAAATGQSELGREVAFHLERSEQTKAELLAANLRLVLRVARRYLGRGLPLLDLIQEGNLGLLRAIDGFDPERGNRLGTYAIWWIRQAMRHALAEQGRVVRVPRHLLETLQTVQRFSRTFAGRFGRQPTPEEASNELGLPQQAVERALESMRVTVSYDAPLADDGPLGLGDLIADEEAADPAHYLLDKDFAHQAREALLVLEDDERRVLELRFGIGGTSEHSVEEVAGELGVTRERVRELEARALRKLQRTKAARGLRVYARD